MPNEIGFYGRLWVMTDDVDRAVAALREAASNHGQARTALHAAIRQALADGRTQADLVRQTGYTRERIRQIAKESQGGVNGTEQ